MNAFMARIWLFVTEAWIRVEHLEPARMRASWVALVAVAGVLGYGTQVAHWDGLVQAGLTILAIAVPAIQGELTRKHVWSPAGVADAIDAALIPVEQIADVVKNAQLGFRAPDVTALTSVPVPVTEGDAAAFPEVA